MREHKVFRDKKPKRRRVALIIGIVVVVLLVALQALTLVIYNQTFGRRYSSDDNLGLYRFDDYPDLARQKVEFESDKKQKLVGYFYNGNIQTKPKGVIVLNHGFGGGGHLYYLPQINYFVNNNYSVFAFDKTGNDESEGKKVKGLPQGVIDLEYALDVVRSDSRTSELPIMLYGHSWGGYSVCSALEEQKDIAAAVSVSGFNKSADVLLSQGAEMYGSFVKMLTPFLVGCDIFNYGFDCFYSSEKGLKVTDSPVLLLHSDDDKMVPIEDSFRVYQEKLGDKKNLTFLKMTDKNHEPFYTIEGIKYLQERNKYLKEYKQENPDITVDAFNAVLIDGYDKALANKLDEAVMAQIVGFYDAALDGGNQ